mmetsp:Transcript_33838/g.66797  ORF Transcript_33838/g.66797 Transcript_33838/m.66797 type:complete len:332 (-) Transcript_33838:102-1097(-)|eukprot:CAMPEP_0194316972 /NCGR_PEP_ID=MMETSP0171-20130528/13717_1 /TAXON_ID=218684 /ORGANISM="Corethron pennatum, Strain L29A3" /LENGTH=331 /DNA_ID=CAMNT_0039073399 /DNA_START=210 /DNA_END=1205 /DNA_ORIENTATION=-
MTKPIRRNNRLVAFIRRPMPLIIVCTTSVFPIYYYKVLYSGLVDLNPASHRHNPAPVPLLDLVGVRSMVLHIGSNKDPIMPKEAAGPCAIGIAFEPIVPHLIPEHPQIYVVPSAVVETSGGGMASMYTYNKNGVSSSLSKSSTTDEFWNNNARRKDGKQKFVPTLSLTTLLQSIPLKVEITFIKTDMQGHDFGALAAGGAALVARGVRYIETETFWKDSYQYKEVHNDLCRDWLPLMAKLGYDYDFTRRNEGYCPKDQFGTVELAQQTCAKYIAEYPVRQQTNSDTKYTCNVLWRLKGVASTGNTSPYDHPTLGKKAPYTFTAEEYSSCFK